MNRILLIEDEPGLVVILKDRLAGEGFTVEVAEDGDQGLERCLAESFDLILLDVMLPRRNGFDVCRDLRRRGLRTPILMLTARGQLADRVAGLNAGADDYLAKPFEMIELVARVEALFRRTNRQWPLSDFFEFGSVLVDFKASSVRRRGKPVEVSKLEFKLLRYFIENAGLALTRDQLLHAVWGYDAMPLTRTVDVHVALLRQKVERNPHHPEFIETVYGIGYRFSPNRGTAGRAPVKAVQPA